VTSGAPDDPAPADDDARPPEADDSDDSDAGWRVAGRGDALAGAGVGGGDALAGVGGGDALAGVGGGDALAGVGLGDRDERPYQPSALQLQRLAFRRRQTIRSVLVAAASTFVLGLVLYLVITQSPGWREVRSTFLDWHVARSSVRPILKGLWLNFRLLVFCAVGAVTLGLFIATLRTLRPAVYFPLRALATSYTYIFRGTPLIIVIYVIALGAPGLRLQGTPSTLVLGGTALVITYAGYIAEVFRAGIESIHPSQWAASRSLGLTYRQTLRHIVLPQAVRRVAPPLLNDLVALQKDVGLISLVGPIDAIRAAQINVSLSYNFTPYILAGAFFVLLAIPLIAVTDWVTLRAARRQNAEAGR
jgi:polar amino acid transport system permease protein